MPTAISFRDAVKATKFTTFLGYFVLYRDGKFDAVDFMMMLMGVGDKFLKPDFDSNLQTSKSELSFYDGQQLVYQGSVYKFLESKYAQDYWTQIEKQWNVAPLIYAMRDEMIKLIAHPLNRYKGDFSDTVLYQLWQKYSVTK